MDMEGEGITEGPFAGITGVKGGEYGYGSIYRDL